MNAILIKQLNVQYLNFSLGPLDLAIPKGMITGLIGRNGAGKSTLIQSILGLIPYQGSVLIDGIELKDHDKNKISYVIDQCTFPQNLTPSQIECDLRSIYTTWESETFHTMMDRLQLPLDQDLRTYSKGMKAKFAIVIALSHQADLLILDEATVGLDPIVRDEILDLLLEFIQDEDHTVILSTHITSDLEKIADHILMIDRGRLLVFEEKDRLLHDHIIAHLSDEAFQKLSPEMIIRYQKKPYQIDVLMKKSAITKDIVYDPITLEDLLSMLSKGETL